MWSTWLTLIDGFDGAKFDMNYFEILALILVVNLDKEDVSDAYKSWVYSKYIQFDI